MQICISVYFCVNINLLLDCSYDILLFDKNGILIFFSQIRPENQSASLPYSGVSRPGGNSGRAFISQVRRRLGVTKYCHLTSLGNQG